VQGRGKSLEDEGAVGVVLDITSRILLLLKQPRRISEVSAGRHEQGQHARSPLGAATAKGRELG